LQDAPVDACNLFHGETGSFGIFTEQGVPLKNFHALRAFAALVKTHTRVAARGAVPGRLAIAGALDPERTSATILVSNFASDVPELRLALLRLPWPDPCLIEVRILDATRNLAPLETPREISAGDFPLSLPAPAVALITLRPSPPGARIVAP
jgi:hypothetical protein